MVHSYIQKHTDTHRHTKTTNIIVKNLSSLQRLLRTTSANWET